MVTMNLSLNQILVAILLVVLIILSIYLIVLIKNAISAVKKVDKIMDEGLTAIGNIKTKLGDVKRVISNSKVINIADSGLHLVKVALKKKKK